MINILITEIINKKGLYPHALLTNRQIHIRYICMEIQLEYANKAK